MIWVWVKLKRLITSSARFSLPIQAMKGDDVMKKTTLILVLLVIFSTILIAGCTTQQPVATTPTQKPSVTAVPTYVQNQQGVAIIRTVAVQTNQTVTDLTNKTEQKVANLTSKL